MTGVADLLNGYIGAGVPVLPLHAARNGQCSCRDPECVSAAKHPLVIHGKDDATTDPEVVHRWLARWPWCNWGARPPKGVVVLDIDPRNGGDATLAALEAEHGRLPATLTARTGSGGLHYWLTNNGATRGKLGRGIDVKTNSGYVVVPPSVHACGGSYEWISTRPAAWAPAWVRRLLSPPVPRSAYVGGGDIAPLVRFVAGSVEGERNRRLYWAACRAHEKGLDTTPLIDAALGVGLTESAAAATIRSAGHAVPRHPQEAA